MRGHRRATNRARTQRDRPGAPAAAAGIAPDEIPPIDVQQLDQVCGSYSYLRPAMHAVLDAVALKGATSDTELLAMLKRLRHGRGRFVDESVELLPKACARGFLTPPVGCNAPAWSSGCGSSRATRCARASSFARSVAATPTPLAS